MLIRVSFLFNDEQLHGFIVNRGKVPICEAKFTAVIPEGAVLKSFWPDWATNPEEAFIDPGQVADIGLTINPRKMKDKKAVPGVDVDRFLDCSLEAVNDVNEPLKFRVERIENVHPARVEMLAAKENLVSPQVHEVDIKDWPITNNLFDDFGLCLQQDGGRPRSHWPVVGPGECGVYTRGDAEFAYCVDSLIEVRDDIKQVRSTLLHIGMDDDENLLTNAIYLLW